MDDIAYRSHQKADQPHRKDDGQNHPENVRHVLSPVPANRVLALYVDAERCQRRLRALWAILQPHGGIDPLFGIVGRLQAKARRLHDLGKIAAISDHHRFFILQIIAVVVSR